MSKSWIKAKATTVHYKDKQYAFASKFEAEIFMSLICRQMAKQITDLTCQPEFELKVNDIRIGKYTADFAYIENKKKVVVEAKGYMTKDASLRIRVFKALYPEIEFVLVKQNKKVRRGRKK